MQVRTKNPNNNVKSSLVTQLLTKFKELENGFQGWISTRSLPVEVAVVAATSGIQGAAIGCFYGTLAKFEPVNKLIPFKNFGNTRLIQARNFAVLMAADAAVSCALKRLRGKEDVESRMAAAFASGFMFQLVSIFPKFRAADAVMYGAMFAAWQGFWHKEGLVHNVFTSSPLLPVQEESRYTKAKCMLSELGYQSCEKTFKKNLFTDNALPLLKDSDLKEAAIPVGARAVILDHIKRDADRLKMQES